MRASLGISSTVPEECGSHRHAGPKKNADSTAFAVTQALVSLLAQKGTNYKLLQAQLSAEKCKSFVL